MEGDGVIVRETGGRWPPSPTRKRHRAVAAEERRFQVREVRNRGQRASRPRGRWSVPAAARRRGLRRRVIAERRRASARHPSITGVDHCRVVGAIHAVATEQLGGGRPIPAGERTSRHPGPRRRSVRRLARPRRPGPPGTPCRPTAHKHGPAPRTHRGPARGGRPGGRPPRNAPTGFVASTWVRQCADHPAHSVVQRTILGEVTHEMTHPLGRLERSAPAPSSR